MKKFNLKKTHILRRASYSQLVTLFKRAFRIIGGESESTPYLQVSMKGLPDIFSTYDEHQRMNSQLLEMGMHKAEAIQFMRERARLA